MVARRITKKGNDSIRIESSSAGSGKIIAFVNIAKGSCRYRAPTQPMQPVSQLWHALSHRAKPWGINGHFIQRLTGP
jgi:hypothetical protein